jgi:hypothetical protein
MMKALILRRLASPLDAVLPSSAQQIEIALDLLDLLELDVCYVKIDVTQEFHRPASAMTESNSYHIESG